MLSKLLLFRVLQELDVNVISQEECQSQWGYGKGRVEVSLFDYCLISHLRNMRHK